MVTSTKILTEDTRSRLLDKSKRSDKERDGKTRFEKRLKSKVASSNKEYNQIDMNKLFKKDILTVNIPVHGETDNYLVKLSFAQILESIRNTLHSDEKTITIKNVIQGIMKCFNNNDVEVFCNCPDFKYRIAYWATRNKTIADASETRPSKITNPHDTKGAGCKHVMLVLNNTVWVMKVASVIINYIKYVEKYYPKKYADIIYPAIYDRPYEDVVQTTFYDDEEPDIDAANRYARTKNRWTSDTAYRTIKTKPDVTPGQTKVED